jgi:NtrC-family two-component system sensor histidine kinase KinB
MIGLRQKLSLGFGGLLVIIVVIGVQSVMQLRTLGESIDVILRENYRSVVACQDMKESLERIDTGVLFSLLGHRQESADQVARHRQTFEKALQIELNNITLPGEGEKARRLKDLFTRYEATVQSLLGSDGPTGRQRDIYFKELLPLFVEIKDTADGILQMNQQNMNEANDRARLRAASARKRMYILLLAGIALAIGFILSTERWVLRPINRLIRSAEEIKQGNLDLVVQRTSGDEIGQLSATFNEMAASLREFRRTDRAKLDRVLRATQRAFDSLPDAIALVDPEGRVEVATKPAQNIFGLKPETRIGNMAWDAIHDLFKEALSSVRPARTKEQWAIFQRFVDDEERYFRPEAVPILDSAMQPTGVVLVFQDVTQLRQQDEMKKGLVSTVSHQLKTPLTSIRMAIHLLLEEKVGTITEKQAELLVAAREDSERLHNIVNKLLDMGRIEAGRAEMQFQGVSPHMMVMEAVEPFRRAAEDQGLTLHRALPDDLPEVWADPARIGHVFHNILSNALNYTAPGGHITISASADEGFVYFSVSDTGRGVPKEFLSRVFDPFFRVPGQEREAGTGLGLAIVKQIVEAHGGTVGVKSEGKGSTFAFSLRRAQGMK